MSSVSDLLFFNLLLPLFFDMETAANPGGCLLPPHIDPAQMSRNIIYMVVEIVFCLFCNIDRDKEKSDLSFNLWCILQDTVSFCFSAHIRQCAVSQSLIISSESQLHSFFRWQKRKPRLFNPQLPATMFSALKVLQQNGSCCISKPQITESRKRLKTSWHSDPWVSQRFSKGLACTLVHWNNAKWCGYEGNVCQNCWAHFNYREGLCNPPDIIQK